jgi:hypothetical protein
LISASNLDQSRQVYHIHSPIFVVSVLASRHVGYNTMQVNHPRSNAQTSEFGTASRAWTLCGWRQSPPSQIVASVLRPVHGGGPRGPPDRLADAYSGQLSLGTHLLRALWRNLHHYHSLANSLGILRDSCRAVHTGASHFSYNNQATRRVFSRSLDTEMDENSAVCGRRPASRFA